MKHVYLVLLLAKRATPVKSLHHLNFFIESELVVSWAWCEVAQALRSLQLIDVLASRWLGLVKLLRQLTISRETALTVKLAKDLLRVVPPLSLSHFFALSTLKELLLRAFGFRR